MTRTSLPWFLELALCLVACASCSDSTQSFDTPRGVSRLELYPTAPEPRSSAVVVTGKLSWPQDLASVSVQGVQARWLPEESGAGEPLLHLSMEPGASKFPDTLSIHLKGSFDPSTFNKLVISVNSTRECFVRCVFRRAGVAILGSTNRAHVAARADKSALERIVLELPTSGRVQGTADEIEFFFDNVQASLRLGSIELCRQPIWAWLPAAEQGFRMVSLDSDAQNSVGLSTARTLEATVGVTPGAELRFSVGIPDALRLGGMQPIVRVEVRGKRGRPLVLETPLETDLGQTPRWHAVRVTLDRFAGQHARIVFSFRVSDSGREAVCALTQPRVQTAKPAPRTVLLVTSDTHRADSVGAMNPPVAIHTPTIDALAQRGVLFEDCWASSNVTIPSHAAIMTGTSPRDTGVLDNYTRLSRNAVTLAEVFQEAGFETCAVVSAAHLSDASSGLGQGFDRMGAPAESKRSARESIGQLTGWLGDVEDQDLFAWLHVYDAHTPYDPPPEFEGRYWPAGRDAFDPSLPEPAVPAVYRVNMPEGLRDLGLLSARYRGEVSYLDAELARLFEVPRIHAGVIALTADHGECLGEHGIFWEHAGLYTQTIHVPLILAWPKAPARTRVSKPVFQLDLAQTLLRLVHVQDPRIPGGDLLAPPSGSEAPRFTLASGADRASVTKDRWHLIISLRMYRATVGAVQEPFPRHRVELFNLATDPACEHDVAHEEVERARDLRRLLCTWLSSATPRGWDDRENPDPEMAEHLAQLGYVAQSGASMINPIDPDCGCAECAPFLPRR